jgi:iron complex outermembrane receptor protein
VTVRYTSSKSFIAPNQFDLYGPNSSVFSSTSAIDGVSRSVNLRQGSNPDLKPTTSKSRSVGVVLEPKALPGLRLTADYLDAELAGFISTVGTATIIQSVEQLGTASPYAGQVAKYAFPGQSGAQPITGPGDLKAFLAGGGLASEIYVSDAKRNVTAAVVRCIDGSVDYTFKTPLPGTVELGTTGTFFIDDKIQSLPTSSFYEYAGHVTTAEGTMPGYRFYSTATWRDAAWEVTVGNTYVAALTDVGSGGAAASPEMYVASYMAWDVGAAWRQQPLWCDATAGHAGFHPRFDPARRGHRGLQPHRPALLRECGGQVLTNRGAVLQGRAKPQVQN